MLQSFTKSSFLFLIYCKLRKILHTKPAVRKYIAVTFRKYFYFKTNIIFVSGIRSNFSFAEKRIFDYAKSYLKTLKSNSNLPTSKLKLALVSPMPPEKTGIAQINAKLVPELANFYEITVITNQEIFSSEWRNYVHDVQNDLWFELNFIQFDRVLYCVGNNIQYHRSFLDLFKKIPGVISIHDFYLSCLMSDQQDWVMELYYSHGFPALKQLLFNGEESIKQTYPINFSYLQTAIGKISHSKFSKELAKNWYGEKITENWCVVPLWSNLNNNLLEKRSSLRELLKIDKDTFLVCSFGFLHPFKLNHRLINAWAISKLHKSGAKLVLVGEHLDEEYRKICDSLINKFNLNESVVVTGWTDEESYLSYLVSADLAIQLRSFSRGESSGAVTDCLANGIPLIVNKHGTFSELPSDIVNFLPDNFTDKELASLLGSLYLNLEKRIDLKAKSIDYVKTNITSKQCATLYAQSIENFYQNNAFNHPGFLVQSQLNNVKNDIKNQRLRHIVKSVAKKASFPPGKPQLLVDITGVRNSSTVKTEIDLLESSYPDFRIEPIYLSFNKLSKCYRYARKYTLFLYNLPYNLHDDIVDLSPNDVLLLLDKNPWSITEDRLKIYNQWRKIGLRIFLPKFTYLPQIEADGFF